LSYTILKEGVAQYATNHSLIPQMKTEISGKQILTITMPVVLRILPVEDAFEAYFAETATS
jgi:hypothetical protein